MNYTKETQLSETKEIEEIVLITRAQQGDTEAFSPLVRKYQQKIYTLIYQHVRDRETAKDITQDVFLKAFRALPGFKGESVFYSWLYQIAVNCCIDYHRKQKSRAVLERQEFHTNPDDTLRMTKTHPSPCQLMEQKELRHILRKACQHLPPMRHRVFTLRYTEELSIKEIASKLNKSEGTVKTHLYHAHRQLRDMLRPYLQNEPLQWYRET